MNIEKLVAMANQIGAFHRRASEADAAAAIAEHLRKFWAPPMRDALIAHLAAGGTGLTQASRRAAELLAPAAPPQAGPASGAPTQG